MSARSFKSVFMVASCAGAALGCYLVSLRVATERAALEDVETKIVLAQRDLRLLQTEIGTRGRLAQLERWNVKVLALSAPSADQFLNGGFELAKLTAPERKDQVTAPVVLASAPAPANEGPTIDSDGASVGSSSQPGPGGLLHHASLKREVPATAKPVEKIPAVPRALGPAAIKAPAERKAAEKSSAKTGPKPAAKAKAAAADPLALMPAKPAPRKLAALNKAPLVKAGATSKPSATAKPVKDSAKKQ
jgi:hypothetical protein